jgi:hypothetical protein
LNIIPAWKKIKYYTHFFYSNKTPNILAQKKTLIYFLVLGYLLFINIIPFFLLEQTPNIFYSVRFFKIKDININQFHIMNMF